LFHFHHTSSFFHPPLVRANQELGFAPLVGRPLLSPAAAAAAAAEVPPGGTRVAGTPFSLVKILGKSKIDKINEGSVWICPGIPSAAFGFRLLNPRERGIF
jgi:hypothetical protein